MAALALGSLWTPVARAQSDDAETILRDTEIEETLHQECDPVFIAAGLDPKTVKLILIGTKEINAQTTSGPTILVFTGLMNEAETPNQLIGVMAHETGHAAGGHIARSDEGMKSALRTFLLTMGLGIAAAAAGRPDAGAALMYNASYFATLDYLGYSRIQESDADQAAVTPTSNGPASRPRGSSISSTSSATRKCSTTPTSIRSSRATRSLPTGSRRCGSGPRSRSTTAPPTAPRPSSDSTPCSRRSAGSWIHLSRP